jgi:hypothetical protein
MTVQQFAGAVAQIGQTYAGSITSWGRTVKHSIQVGGFDGDPHTWWLGADMVYDSPPVQASLEADCALVGLHVIHEGSHDHYQPVGWVNAPH